MELNNKLLTIARKIDSLRRRGVNDIRENALIY
jgi:hypothetical protein